MSSSVLNNQLHKSYHQQVHQLQPNRHHRVRSYGNKTKHFMHESHLISKQMYHERVVDIGEMISWAHDAILGV